MKDFAVKKSGRERIRKSNDMERDLVNAGTVVLKFWLHIDKEEQERRFRAREKIRTSSGRSRRRLEEPGKNGISMRRQSMR